MFTWRCASTALLKRVTMSFFGMVNWHYLWFWPGAGLTRADYADLVTRLIAEGATGFAEEREPEVRAVGE